MLSEPSDPGEFKGCSAFNKGWQTSISRFNEKETYRSLINVKKQFEANRVPGNLRLTRAISTHMVAVLVCCFEKWSTTFTGTSPTSNKAEVGRSRSWHWIDQRRYHCGTKDQIADFSTKPLKTDTFLKPRAQLGVWSPGHNEELSDDHCLCN